MTDSDELLTIIHRIQQGNFSENDIRRLRELAKSKDPGTVKQLGKYDVKIGKGQGIQIGDNVYLQLDKIETPQQVDSGFENDNRDDRWKSLELKVDAEVIETINQKLEIVSRYQKEEQLSGEVEEEFSEIKRKVRAIQEIEEELSELANRATALVEDLLSSLEKELVDLGEQREKTVQRHEKEIASKKMECIKSYLAMYEEFRDELSDGKEGAKWINENLTQLSNAAGNYALNASILSSFRSFEEVKVERFCFSVMQYLERISHSLEWGNYDLLDSAAEVSSILPKKFYRRAFRYVENSIPEHLPKATQSQIKDYINYLAKRI